MKRRRTARPGPWLRFCVILVYPLTSVAVKRRWLRPDRIPAEGAAIIAVNHISYADPFILARFIWDCGRNPRYLAKSSLFTFPVTGRIVRGAGQIPVYRGTADADMALRGAVQALGRGEMVLIYPEGTVTRDPDFWPMQAKTGVARLALLAPGVPVIPVGQWGAQDFLDFYHRRFSPFPRKRVTVSAGEPIDFSRFSAGPASSEVLHEMTEQIMGQVRDLVAGIRHEPPPTTFYPRPDRAGTPTARERRRKRAGDRAPTPADENQERA